MSVCTLIAADWPLPEIRPSREYPLHIDLDKGTICDGDADDNYCLLFFEHAGYYTGRQYGVVLQWAYYTEGRARQIIGYIKSALKHTDRVELWHMWLGDLEDGERPAVRVSTVSAADLTPEDIQKLDRQEIWSVSSRCESRPIYACLKVIG